jgi:hypothetical protein
MQTGLFIFIGSVIVETVKNRTFKIKESEAMDMAERSILSVFLLHSEEISLDKAAQLREDLILTGLTAELIDFEDIERIWLFIIPPDVAANTFDGNEDKPDRVNFSGGECLLVKVSPDWDRKVAKGIIGIGPDNEIVGEEIVVPISPISGQKKKANDFYPPVKVLKSANSFSSPRLFASFYINSLWTEEEFETRIYDLCEFLTRSGFLSPNDLLNLGIVKLRIEEAGQSVILLYSRDSPSGENLFSCGDFPFEKKRPESEKPDESADFNPDILNDVLKRRRSDE